MVPELGPHMSGGTTFGSTALELALKATRAAGLDCARHRLSRVQSSAHVEFPEVGVLARVERTGRVAYAHRQVAAALAWARTGAPVVRLVRPESQPFVYGDHAVTLWQRLESGGDFTLADLGHPLRALHDVGRAIAPDTLRAIDPLADVAPWVDAPARWLSDADREGLRTRLDELSAWWRDHATDDPLGCCPVHGDVHRENVVNTPDGIVFVDLEDAGFGPRSWDFAPLAVGVRRYGDDAPQFDALVRVYGEDPRAWSAFETLCDCYEFEVAVWALYCSLTSPHMVEEAQIRIDSLFGRGSTRWTMS